MGDERHGWYLMPMRGRLTARGGRVCRSIVRPTEQAELQLKTGAVDSSTR